jgi:hypothetical protein
LDSAKLPKCFTEVVDQILQNQFAILELIVNNAEYQATLPTPQKKRSIIGKVFHLLRDSKRQQIFLYELYQRWDKRNVDPVKAPHATVECSAYFAQVAISKSPNRLLCVRPLALQAATTAGAMKYHWTN